MEAKEEAANNEESERARRTRFLIEKQRLETNLSGAESMTFSILIEKNCLFLPRPIGSDAVRGQQFLIATATNQK